MKKNIYKIKNMKLQNIPFTVSVLLCTVIIAMLLNIYFKAYTNPYLMNEILDLSEGWHYSTGEMEERKLDTLLTGPFLQGGETLSLSRILDKEIKDATILLRTNHQSVRIYLDGLPLYLDKEMTPRENPGMALHFLTLPKDYLNKTLQIELTSPYTLYAGRTSPILMGSIPSLEAYVISRSMRSVILMAMSLLIGFGILILTAVQSAKGSPQAQHLSIGIFAVIWALYYVCTELVVFQFFSPLWVSTLSLGLYYTFQVPLVLYFYFSFRHYKRFLLPPVILHSGFAAVAILLQVLDIVDLPILLNINNILLAGLGYTLVLSVLEARKGNRPMLLAAPFFAVAYLSMLYNFYVFYYRSGVVPYTYKDTYFLLLLCILIFNVWEFFSRYYRGIRESEALTLQNRLAKEGYERIKTHIHEVGGLKHEMKNHLAALQTYLNDERYSEANSYLKQIAGQTAQITDAIHHDHYLINAAASRLLLEAKEGNIKIGLNLKPVPIRLADPDLHSLFSNILDNALEACNRIAKGQERFIRLTVSRREPYLLIVCENSHRNEIRLKEGRIHTIKENWGHGYGLRTIEKIADMYEGLVDIDFDENTFTITVALKD